MNTNDTHYPDRDELIRNARSNLIKEIQTRLGLGMVDLEADPEHYDLAITMAIDRYRQRASNALEESFLFLDSKKDTHVYYLPPEVQLVREVLRRGIGSSSGSGSQIDPFSLAFTNNMYMLANPGTSASPSGYLATYDFAMQYQELAGRLFGRDLVFNYEQSTGRFTLHRKMGADETIMLWIYNQKPEEMIITNVHSKPWIRDYSVSMVKLIIGEARSKFSQIAGPQGGFSLNGDALKAEALAELERLDHEIKNQVDGNMGYGFVVG